MEIIHELWSLFIDSFEFFMLVILIGLTALYIHDKYIQRRHSLLINYPIIGTLPSSLKKPKKLRLSGCVCGI